MAAKGLAADPYKYFRPEARDLLDQFAKGILELESGRSGVAAVQRLLRIAHTLKGAARVVKQNDIADRAHAIEDALAPFRDRVDGVARPQIDEVLEHLDRISNDLQRLAPAGAESGAASGHPAPRNDESSRTVRADVAETDTVLEGAAETHALLAGLRNAVRGLEHARHLADLLIAQLAPQSASLDPAERARGSDRQGGHVAAVAQELRRKFATVERSLGGAIDQMDRELHQLRDAAERLRLGSAESLLLALERTARDTARAVGRPVVFAGKGGDIRLDSHIVETVQGALIQIVRNAVAHGIETEEERRAAGKPALGRVSVTVSRRGRRIAFECSDDGRGIDLDAVRRVAAERGLLDMTAGTLGNEEVIRLLLRGGISTAPTVTGVAGRGVGLDVVREAAEQIGGEVVFRTGRGTGTMFGLVVPASLASMEALIVATGEAGAIRGAVNAGSRIGAAAIPLDAVRGTMRIGPAALSRAAPGASITYEHRTIPFIPLATALGGAGWSSERNWATVVVAASAGLAAIGVERLLGTSRIVVRPLPERLSASPIAAGVMLDAEGNPQLVLDADGLVAAAQRGEAVAPNPAPATHPILVVDDSLTTRMLEQSILESAGYQVDVALCGEEALDILRRRRYALILVDVDMPGMDGFAFIERIRANAATRDVPAILVTSRAMPEDFRRGREVGAQGYIVKSRFDQAELLKMIAALTGE